MPRQSMFFSQGPRRADDIDGAGLLIYGAPLCWTGEIEAMMYLDAPPKALEVIV